MGLLLRIELFYDQWFGSEYGVKIFVNSTLLELYKSEKPISVLFIPVFIKTQPLFKGESVTIL